MSVKMTRSCAHLTMRLHQASNDMQCDTTLPEGDVALHREGMARSTKWGETRRGILASAYEAREETRVITRTTL